MVAFGVLCLLMLEGRPLSEIEETARFCKTVGLPTTLADLKLGKATTEDIGEDVRVTRPQTLTSETFLTD